MSLKLIFNPFTSSLDWIDQGGSFWGSPVTDLTTLNAITTDGDGSVRLVLTTNDAYRWNLGSSQWQYVAKVKTSAVGSAPNANAFTVGSDNTFTLEPADATHPGVVTTGTQTLAGNKTFTDSVSVNGSTTLNALQASSILDTGNLTVNGTSDLKGNVTQEGTVTTTGVSYTNGGIDLSAPGTLAIGTSANSTTINIGNVGATVNIQGTVITETTTTLNVTNPVFTVNSGGSAGSASNAGMQVNENNVITGYAETSGDRNSWALKAPNTAGIATITPGSSGITINQSSHNPVTIGTANGLTLSTQQISLDTSSGSTTGSLSSTDWNTFNGKQPAGNYITATTGDVVATGPGNVTATIQAGAVTNAKIAAAAGIQVNKLAALNPSVAVTSDGSGFLTSSVTTGTEIGYVSGVTSAIQTQLNNKPNKSSGDFDETSFSGANNQSSATNVTGFAFSSSVTGTFEAMVMVHVSATSPLREQYYLSGCLNGAGNYVMSQMLTGDDTGVVFSITNAGQIQYTSPNITGFTSLTMKYRAITVGI